MANDRTSEAVTIDIDCHGLTDGESDHAAARRVRSALLRIRHDPALALALLLLAILVFAAVLGPVVWRKNPLSISGGFLQHPSLAHPMGTDEDGRDVLARFDEGARISLLSGLAVVVIGGVFGGVLGVASGMSDGLLDGVLMRATDSVLAFPALILAMAVSIGLGPGLVSGVIGITLGTIPYYGRLLRTEVKRIRGLPHVDAARALGVRESEIIWRHILPHSMSTMLVQSASVFGYAILTLAGLGFVGLGARIPTPEWGAMITEGLQYTLTGQWWLTVFPGIGVLICVAAANLLADRLRVYFDPRRQVRQ
jgi:peptide/nickel transport system permease protein